jgi:hypothetical protein
MLSSARFLPSMLIRFDNAVIESFFATLKAECARHRFATRDRARRQIFEVIELGYNCQRLHSGLGYLSPAEFEHRLSSDTIRVQRIGARSTLDMGPL